MSGRLDGQRVIVTGSGRGIGRAIAHAAAREGARVVVHGRTEGSAARVALEIREAGGLAEPFAFHLEDMSALQAGMGEIVAAGPVDALINNAAQNRPGLLVASAPEDIASALRANLLAPVLAARAVLPSMLAQRRGVIVNIGSVSASRPARGQSVYVAAKGGLESFTRALAVEYGKKGIRAVCLRPGPVDTDMMAATKNLDQDLVRRVPLGRIARPEEIANFCIFLLTDDAAFVTGSVLDADGGFSCSTT